VSIPIAEATVPRIKRMMFESLRFLLNSKQVSGNYHATLYLVCTDENGHITLEAIPESEYDEDAEALPNLISINKLVIPESLVKKFKSLGTKEGCSVEDLKSFRTQFMDTEAVDTIIFRIESDLSEYNSRDTIGNQEEDEDEFFDDDTN